jgi:hypothetical protein
MPNSRSHRQTDAGRPGPQMLDNTTGPKTPAGMPPAPNPGQAEADLGAGYTMLRGGQDVQQPGLYFDEQTHEVRYWDKGQTIGHARTGDTWLYLTPERGTSSEDLEQLIRERGYGGPLDDLRVTA